MEKIYWMIGNLLTLVAAIFFAIFTSLPGSTSTEGSQVATPFTESEFTTEINNLVVSTVVFTTEEEAQGAFLTQFSGANVAPFINGKEFKSLGYSGYYAWYDGSLATHVVLLKNLTIIKITFTNTKLMSESRIFVMEQYVLHYLEKSNNAP